LENISNINSIPASNASNAKGSSKIAYTLANSSGLSVFTSNRDGSNAVLAYSNPLKDWLLFTINDSLAFLLSKSSGKATSFAFSLNLKNGSVSPILSNIYGLSILPNKKGDLILYSDTNFTEPRLSVYDINKKIKFVLTGSSSKLLSKEISTVLRGRALNKEIFPLSFKEIVLWKGLKYNLKTIAYSKDKIEIKKLFNNFIQDGGYPAVTYQKVNREEVLQSYYESMIFKDIVERYKIEDVKKIKMLANLLLESTSKDISYSKLANKLKSIGMNTSKNTIIEFLSYFEDAYLFFQNIKYEYSQGKQLGSIKKVYFIDNGMLNSVSFKFSKDTGKLLENLIFLELRRRNKKIFYNRDNYECDFIIQEKEKVVRAIQVTENLNSENEKREVEGILEAVNKFKLKEGFIITLDEERDIEIKGKKICVLPVWKWLLE
jgi:predicted AAA+ superfamily ATPase